MIAASSPPRPNAGTARAARSGSRSPTASAYPRWRTAASSAASLSGSVNVRGVNGRRAPGSGRADPPGPPKASITLPAAVAYETLGRPMRARLTTLEADGTKSTVIASSSPGSESVAVSPVAATSCVSRGRASWGTSS